MEERATKKLMEKQSYPLYKSDYISEFALDLSLEFSAEQYNQLQKGLPESDGG